MESSAVDIQTIQLLLGYILLLIPVVIFLYYRIRVLKEFAVSILRMTIQLLLVGFYLQFVFDLNYWWLNILWLIVMLGAANFSLLSSSGISLRRFLAPVFISLLAGTGVPLLYFLGIILQLPHILDAQYFIPIAGMIMGNSMRANIVGMRSYYTSLHTEEPAYLYALSQGASLKEAVAPFFRNAFEAAVSPTLATMATVGIVSLPGMMTGIILGGTNPMVAIKYQIAIMIAIFTGTVLSVFLGIRLTMNRSFNAFGVLDKTILR